MMIDHTVTVHEGHFEDRMKNEPPFYYVTCTCGMESGRYQWPNPMGTVRRIVKNHVTDYVYNGPYKSSHKIFS